VRLDLHETLVVTPSTDPILRAIVVDVLREGIYATTDHVVAREVVFTSPDRTDVTAILTPTT
jgi:hypothetical protein